MTMAGLIRLFRDLFGVVLLLISLTVPAGQEIDAQSDTQPRGYLTTPAELKAIAEKAASGLEPYAAAVKDVLKWAEKDWNLRIDAHEACKNADRPRWIDNSGGAPILYASALSYHLTGDTKYAEKVAVILEEIMSKVESISLEEQQCRLTFSWGIPEVVASADLIEAYWHDRRCEGPLSFTYEDPQIGTGDCKTLFQNWLAKNPYYVISLSAEEAQSNWGAAATNALAYMADYLWDREDIVLVHRVPALINDGIPLELSPAQAYTRANALALQRMNGYRVEYHSSNSCDYLSGEQQSDEWEPIKSQITELGIIPEDARRQQYCNVPIYNGDYQNYPQIHLGHNIQQCELMLRRGNTSCFDNIDMSDLPDYSFIGPDGKTHTTHLRPGRGSIERAIDAVIVDADTEWQHDSALEIAFRYYFTHDHHFDGLPFWFHELNRPSSCDQDVCFGTLTHGFMPGEVLAPPPTTAPPVER